MGIIRGGPRYRRRGKEWLVECTKANCHEFEVIVQTEQEAQARVRNHICQGSPNKNGKW